MNGNAHHHAPLYAIRRSIALFLLKLVAIEMLLSLLHPLWRTIIESPLLFGASSRATLGAVSMRVLLVITLLQGLVFIVMTLRWYFDYLVLMPTEIVHRCGVLAREEQMYPYHNIQAIRMHEPILGRFLNYGTVSIFISTLGYELHFHSLPNPEQFVEMIENIMHASSEKPAEFLRQG